MCGIIGYIGYRDVTPILLKGLKRMEYRGYDSAGIASIDQDRINIVKVRGKIDQLVAKVKDFPVNGHIGLGHTRWATHGEPNEINAHPHADESGRFILVHNGIIENYNILKIDLINKGHTFRTETDSEVLSHLISELYDGDLYYAVKKALRMVKGTYGIGVMCLDEPDKLIAARMGSPLVIGIGSGEHFIASDLAAIVEYTRDVIFLDDGEISLVTADSATHSLILNGNKEPVQSTDEDGWIEKKMERISFDIDQIEKNGYPYFMLKEIHEQPNSVRDAMRGRLIEDEGTARLGGLLDYKEELSKVRRFIILGCGTSWHAALIGKYLIEEIARIPVDVEYASEFRYRNPIIEPNTIALAISQSGETADTLEAMREAKRRGASLALGICNVVGSTIARESDGGVYIHAGPEIGVASTKAFTAQVTVFVQLALQLGRERGLPIEKGRELVHELYAIPDKISSILAQTDYLKEIGEQFIDRQNALYLSRSINYPVALEGALKLKEISYIHAEGYPAAEMKHGPIALIDENMPVFFIAVSSRIYDKVINNIEQVKARNGIIIAVVSEDDTVIERYANHIIRIPKVHPYLSPLLTVIPLQLLAYHVAVARGCDVDQPRNLAKSVTVE